MFQIFFKYNIEDKHYSVKEMSANEFAFSVAIRKTDEIKDLKIRCDCTDEIEISGVLSIEEMSLVEDSVLRIEGRFGEIDFSLSRFELKKLLKGEKK